jgi:hypothetical protein
MPAARWPQVLDCGMADDLPIACTLDARALAGRQSELRDSVLAEAESVERRPNGYRWRFRGGRDLLARLGVVIDAERHCCRFLRFAIDVQPDLGSVTAEITGPEGTADFLESWIAPAPPS